MCMCMRRVGTRIEEWRPSACACGVWARGVAACAHVEVVAAASRCMGMCMCMRRVHGAVCTRRGRRRGVEVRANRHCRHRARHWRLELQHGPLVWIVRV